jgi:hypothetical protein
MIKSVGFIFNSFWRHLLATSLWVGMCKMGENIKSGSFLQKPPETLVYAIYIERWSPFRICYIIYLSTGCGCRGTWTPSGRTIFKPWPIRPKISTIIYLTHAQMVVKPDSPLPFPFITNRDMQYDKWGGERVFRVRITPPDICSGVSWITNIHIGDETSAQLWR